MAMLTRETPAAITPYPIAVAPVSSFQNPPIMSPTLRGISKGPVKFEQPGFAVG
jgi:hypothetical protein